MKFNTLDFDVRVGTVIRGGQTRRRTVPGRPTGSLATGNGDGGSSGDGVFVSDLGAGLSVVAIGVVPVATAVRPERADRPDGRVLDDDPRAPNHGESQHFHRLGRRYGHHVVAGSSQHGHRDGLEQDVAGRVYFYTMTCIVSLEV